MKKFLLITLIITLLFTLSACAGNATIFDTEWTFKKAVIVLGDKTVIVDVAKWSDYQDTSRQIITTDGQVYLGSVNNITLIKE